MTDIAEPLLHCIEIYIANKYETYYRVSTGKGVHTTVVTAGHCTHAELTSGHAFANCYSCCMHSIPGLC